MVGSPTSPACLYFVSTFAAHNPESLVTALFDLVALGDEWVPERFGTSEPLNLSYDRAAAHEAFQQSFGKLLFARSQKLGISFFVPYASDGRLLGPAEIHVTAKFPIRDAEPLVAYFKATAERLSVDFGAATVLTPGEVSRGRASRTISFTDRAQTRPVFTLNALKLKRCLPDFYWATAFGAPYVAYFRASLGSVSAPSVSEFRKGIAYFQLTERLEDLVVHAGQVEKVRQLSKNQLGAGSFFHPEQGDQQCAVPALPW